MIINSRWEHGLITSLFGTPLAPSTKWRTCSVWFLSSLMGLKFCDGNLSSLEYPFITSDLNHIIKYLLNPCYVSRKWYSLKNWFWDFKKSRGGRVVSGRGQMLVKREGRSSVTKNFWALIVPLLSCFEPFCVWLKCRLQWDNWPRAANKYNLLDGNWATQPFGWQILLGDKKH